jgi:hypothetical protein
MLTSDLDKLKIVTDFNWYPQIFTFIVDRTKIRKIIESET